MLSDLHLSWPTPVEMTNTELVRDFLAASARFARAFDGRVDLVFNGDAFDFTLPANHVTGVWQPDGVRAAANMLDGNGNLLSGFRVFVEGCRSFLEASPSSHVSILPGNHDLEIAHPEVRSLLHERIGVSRRVEFLRGEADGTLRIADVWIEHGNRLDPQNHVDYSSLERAIAHKTEYEVPVGHRVVEAVVNPLKRRFGWIDLIHPLGAVEAILPALDPAMERLWRDLDAAFGLPAASMLAGMPLRDAYREDWVQLRQFVNGLVEEVPPAAHGVAARRHGLVTVEALRLGLAPFLGDLTTMALGRERDTLMKEVENIVRGGARIVVFGHTHCAKWVDASIGAHNASYYNIGSWCRTVQVPPLLHLEKETPRDAVDRFVKALWECDLSDYCPPHAAYACIELEDGRVARHALLSFMAGDRVVGFDAVKGSSNWARATESARHAASAEDAGVT